MSEEQDEVLFCYNHPQRETALRCNRCERPICSECAVLTPTGYRCKECIRGQQKIFDTARQSDYIAAILIAGIFSFAGAYFTGLIGFLTLFLAPFLGGVTAEVIRRAVQKRRAKLMFQLSTAAAVVGSLAAILFGFFGAGTFSLLWQGLFAFLFASTLYYRLSGIQINR